MKLADIIEAAIVRIIEIDVERGGPTLATSSAAHALGKLKSVAVDIELEHQRWKKSAPVGPRCTGIRDHGDLHCPITCPVHGPDAPESAISRVLSRHRRG